MDDDFFVKLLCHIPAKQTIFRQDLLATTNIY